MGEEGVTRGTPEKGCRFSDDDSRHTWGPSAVYRTACGGGDEGHS